MKMSMTQLGHLQAFYASGATFDEFITEHKIPEDMRAEAQVFWDDVAADSKANKGTTMLVPSD
jgi:hypothetical protein